MPNHFLEAEPQKKKKNLQAYVAGGDSGPTKGVCISMVSILKVIYLENSQYGLFDMHIYIRLVTGYRVWCHLGLKIRVRL